METPKNPEMNRRKFIGAAATALFAGVAIQILGCDDDYADNPNSNRNVNPDPNVSDAIPTKPNASTTKSAATASRTGDITAPSSANHPPPQDHIATITGTQLDTGGALTLDIRGNNTSHTHTISLTAADMTNIKNGMMVSKLSTSAGHTHTVTFAAVTSVLDGGIPSR